MSNDTKSDKDMDQSGWMMLPKHGEEERKTAKDTYRKVRMSIEEENDD